VSLGSIFSRTRTFDARTRARAGRSSPPDAFPVTVAVALALCLAACGDGTLGLTDPEEVADRARALKAASSAAREARSETGRPVDPARAVTLSKDRAARIEGEVRRAGGRHPLPCRVWIEDAGGTEPGAVLARVGFWCDGRFTVPVLPGRSCIRSSAGRRRKSVYREAYLKPGRRARIDLELARPANLRFEERGWAGADLFRPVAGGRALRRRVTPELLALAARAEGVSFIGMAASWGRSSFRSAPGSAEGAHETCARLSRDGFTVAPVRRGADAPFYGGLFHLGAREPARVAPVGWDVGWPNFLAIEEARRQGALVVLTGIARGLEMDPRSEIVALEPGLAGYYRTASVALGLTACELPFDAAAGVLPDAVALSGSPEDEAVWFRLLSMGHRIPAVHVAGGSFGEGVIPSERTFVHIGKGKRATLENIVAGVRAGKVTASNGPFVFITIDKHPPGSVLPADGSPRAVVFEAHSSTEKDGAVTRLELIRNGKVIESEPGQAGGFAARKVIEETSTAWYIARARGGPDGSRVAWTSPVYFEGPGYAPPAPVTTRVRGRVTDARTGGPLAAGIEARLFGKVVASSRTDPATGNFTIECSPAARLDARAEGHAPGAVRVFFHTKAPGEIFAIHTNASGRGASVLAEERAYEKMRLACATAEINFRLSPRTVRRSPPERTPNATADERR
jgi:hypothetical protein